MTRLYMDEKNRRIGFLARAFDRISARFLPQRARPRAQQLGFGPAQPAGMSENSPTFQRWGWRSSGSSPEGKAEAPVHRPSLRDLWPKASIPSVETLGYCQLSPPGHPCATLGNPSDIAPGRARSGVIPASPGKMVWLALGWALVAEGSEKRGFGPPPQEQQLPHAMHSQMKELPSITVGLSSAALVGNDNRVLQAAVDYIAGLGGGTVDIGEGEFLMRDSLHLRSFVTVQGTKGKTILRKAKAASSLLALDGDYGEEQVTVVNPDGFEPGCGVAIWDTQSGGFHTTVGRITGRNGNTFSFDMPLNADCMAANKAQ